MKLRIITVVGLLGLGACQSGCAALGMSPADSKAGQALLDKVLTDPKCGHTDRVSLIGGVLTASAERVCPIPVVPVISPAASAAASVGVSSGSFGAPPAP
jgi:hypothetical protein